MTGKVGRFLSAAVRRLALVVPAAAAAAGDAGAQAPPEPAPPGPTPSEAPAEDGQIYVEADELFTDPDTGRYVARGDVVIRYGLRTLRAQEVVVYPETNRVLATGDIIVEDDSGIVTYADQAELSDDLANGVIQGMTSRLPRNATTGAAVGIRRDATRNELRRAFYTICSACNAKGEPKRPTWRLRARRVTQDQDAQMLYYRDAVLEVKGVPVIYTPFFAHADPSSERRSGFLFPHIAESTRTGTSIETPYYWALSDSQDVTLSPRFMSNVNPLLAVEHRKKFFSGGSIIQGSITDEKEFGNDGEKFGEQKWRGHIFSDAEFEMSQHWKWGASVERVSDDLYFARYDIDDSDKARGLYSRGSKRLLSQLFLEGHGDDFHASLATLDFQGLRQDDDEDKFPVLLPLGEYDQRLARDFAGGRLDGRVSTAVLERSAGSDSRRLTAELDWRRQLVSSSGVVVEPFALGRGDLYSVSDFDKPDGEAVNEVFGRGLGYAGAGISWPFGRTAGSFDLIIEPKAQVVVAPTGGNDDRIPNNDSLGMVLDESNIFDPNRVSGYDLWEDGTHAVVGARTVARWSTQSEASLFLGQSYRADDSMEFAASTGLSGDTSDVVGSAEIALNPRRRVAARFQLDERNLGVRRLDVDAAYSLGRATVGGKYLRFNRNQENDPTALDSPSEELSFSTGIELTRNWGVYYAGTRDLELNEDRYTFLGLVYNDECSRLEVIYKRDGTRDRVLNEGESIRLQLTLTGIGSFGGL